jgi:hypothetical protein
MIKYLIFVLFFVSGCSCELSQRTYTAIMRCEYTGAYDVCSCELSECPRP